MKYGVVVYKGTKNIGDDIQSYAAAQLLPQVDYYIEREHLDIFRPDEEEPVNVIMNGWFMYNKLGWPISDYINPLYISMHFWENDALGIGSSFLEGLGGQDFREKSSIGCRDFKTKLFLENAGFKTWFSGCVTLTLEAKFPKKEKGYVCLTDVSANVVEYVRKLYPQMEIRIFTQEEDTLINPSMSWEKRFANVENLLEIYQNAKAVITTRLHCALPCLALETPVLLLSEEEIAEQDRFSGLENLVYHSTTENFIEGKLNYDLLNPPENKKDYYLLRNNIKNAVTVFLQSSKENSAELYKKCKRYDSEWEKRALWKNQQIERLMYSAIKRWNEQHKNLEMLQEGKEWLEQQYYAFLEDNNILKNKNTELYNENVKLCEQNTRLQRQITQFRQEIMQLEQEINENVKLCEQNTRLQRQITQFRQEIMQLEQEITELRNSFSWKIGRALTALPRKILSLKK